MAAEDCRSGSQKSNQAAEAFERMREKILCYEWEPGMRLSSIQIASELNMSRTPIEKALLQLEHYGLATDGNGKFEVSSFDLSDIIEINNVKEAVETQAIKIIFDNGGLTKEQVDLLREVVTKHCAAAKEEDDKNYFKEGSEFHRLMLQFAGNTRLIRIYDQIRYENERAQWLNILLPDKEHSVEEHLKLIDALEQGDLAGALMETNRHSRNTIARYRRILDSPFFKTAVLEASHIYKGQKSIR